MNTRVGTVLLAVSTFFALLCVTVGLWAAPDAATLDRASALYEAGKKAHAAGDHEAAANAFAEADTLLPDVAALEAALVAVVKTDSAVLGMELAERANREPANPKLAALAEKVRARFRRAVGRIVVSCDRCVVLIDAAPTRRGVSTWVSVGAHDVVIREGDAKETRTVNVEAEAVVTILPLSPPTTLPVARPEPEPPPKPRRKRDDKPAASGPSSSWFWVAFAATGAVGIGAVISGVDTALKHAAFSDAPTEQRAIDGEAAETRTNVLLGVTGGLAALTVVIGLFVVDWDQRDDVALTANGLRVRF